MTDYQIITDSTIDMPQELMDELHVTVLPLMFEIGHKSYHHFLDERELKLEEFYKILKAGEFATTSQINIQYFMDSFRPVLEEGKDIIYLAFASALSGTYQSSVAAMNELKEEFPERTLISIDTQSASIGEGLLVYLAAKKKAEGLSIQQLEAWVMEHRQHICTWFTVDDLIHLKRGGRIGAVSATFGTALSIKPVMQVANDGRLEVVTKVRGRKKSIQTIADYAKTDGIPDVCDLVVVAHSADEEAADSVVKYLKEQCGVSNIIKSKIGPIIGAHLGAGAVVIGFYGNPR